MERYDSFGQLVPEKPEPDPDRLLEEYRDEMDFRREHPELAREEDAADRAQAEFEERFLEEAFGDWRLEP